MIRQTRVTFITFLKYILQTLLYAAFPEASIFISFKHMINEIFEKTVLIHLLISNLTKLNHVEVFSKMHLFADMDLLILIFNIESIIEYYVLSLKIVI